MSSPPALRESEQLVRDLREGEPCRRVEAVRALAACDPGAEGALCEALKDRHPAVRIAAAQALGEVGTRDAVPALTGTINWSQRPRSGPWLIRFGMVLYPAWGVLIALSIWGFLSEWIQLLLLPLSLLIVAQCLYVSYHFWSGCQDRLHHSRLCHAVAVALGRIAKRDPAPELRLAVPYLNAVAADSLIHTERTREASREAAARIQSVTAALSTLPVPAVAPQAAPGELPRPAEAPAPEAGGLPRPS